MTRFLVDAQLPYRLALALRQLGYDVVHTRELPNSNRTTDAEINLLPSAPFDRAQRKTKARPISKR
jgi:predicted nuclease of predicted toxin-antitoxin system